MNIKTVLVASIPVVVGLLIYFLVVNKGLAKLGVANTYELN